MKNEELRYGDPPRVEECRDAGEVIVPLKLTMPSTPELQQREAPTIDLVGEELPKWARARIAVRSLEKKGGNLKAKVEGLGVVVVGKEGWKVIE